MNRRGPVRGWVVNSMGTAKQTIVLSRKMTGLMIVVMRSRRHRSENGPWHPYAELHHAEPGSRGFDLAQAAVEELHEAGFQPEFGRDVQKQVSEIERDTTHWRDAKSAADLRGLGWSSIDNDTSKDLDQIEVAERLPTGIRMHVAIGDVAAAVEKGSPIEEHAQNQTQTIYTAVKNFPMLPLELSAGLTSLNENEDRLAIMMSFTVTSNGELLDETVSRSLGEESGAIGVLPRRTVARRGRPRHQERRTSTL